MRHLRPCGENVEGPILSLEIFDRKAGRPKTSTSFGKKKKAKTCIVAVEDFHAFEGEGGRGEGWREPN